tara:strand:+ start:5747 stop:6439 length:693 start_codon:yes stop_codon:yes gene_type:complete
MQQTRRNMNSLVDDENADARISSFFSISAILTVVGVIIWTLAPPPDIGPAEGQLAPDIVGEAHSNGAWEEFRLYDYINHSWTKGESGQLIFLQFMDTDCPHCWSDAPKMDDLYTNYGSNGAVAFVTISAGMLSSDHSRGEIVAFQEKGDRDGCYHDERNCQNRDGGVHDWPYVDDLSMRVFKDYDIPGVPFHLLLSPDGTVIWNSGMHGEDQDPLREPASAIQYHLTESV